jgi:hypothetical protein
MRGRGEGEKKRKGAAGSCVDEKDIVSDENENGLRRDV